MQTGRRRIKRSLFNAYRSIGIGQTIKGHIMQAGVGFIPLSNSDSPFRIINNREVYHITRNPFPFQQRELSYNDDFLIARIYAPFIVTGFSYIGGFLNCYLHKVANYWVLSVHTELESEIFVGTYPQPFDPDAIAWCKVIEGDVSVEIAAVLMRAMLIQISFCEDGEIYSEQFKSTRFTTYFALDRKSLNEFVLGSVFKTHHQSQEKFDHWYHLCPPHLQEHFLHQAVIGSDSHPGYFFSVS